VNATTLTYEQNRVQRELDRGHGGSGRSDQRRDDGYATTMRIEAKAKRASRSGAHRGRVKTLDGDGEVVEVPDHGGGLAVTR
jgi:hypothetical protein